MHARYYTFNLGRFMSVDPVGGSIGSSQSWNRYAYVRGNPVNAADPTGETIGIAKNGNWKKIRQYLISLIQRPSGQKHLETLANAKGFHVVYRDTTITPRAKLRQIQKTNQKAKVTFGTTAPVPGTNGVAYSGATVNIDTFAVSQLHPDRSGVTVTDHENYHVQDLLEQKPLPEVAKGDSPSSETGPAEEQGRRTAAEKPTISRKEAEEILERWLKRSAAEHR